MAALAAGYPIHVPSTTVERKCGSSQQAVHFAAQGIAAGAYDIVIAAGVESMSRIPMGSARIGQDAFGPTLQARYAPGFVRSEERRVGKGCVSTCRSRLSPDL